MTCDGLVIWPACVKVNVSSGINEGLLDIIVYAVRGG